MARLTDERAVDPEYQKTFLATYQSFTELPTLVKLLVARYHVPLPPEQRRVVQARVVNAFKAWLKERFDDFTTDTLKPVWAFVSVLRQDGLSTAADSIQRLIDTQVEGVKVRRLFLIISSTHCSSREPHRRFIRTAVLVNSQLP